MVYTKTGIRLSVGESGGYLPKEVPIPEEVTSIPEEGWPAEILFQLNISRTVINS